MASVHKIKDMKFFKRFNDIGNDYVHTDKHIHTKWVDGQATILEIIQKAEELSLRQIAFTEHIRRDSVYFSGYLNEIQNVKGKSSLEILSGFEAKIMNFEGDIDIADEAMQRSEILIGSVHRFPIGRKLFSPREFTKSLCQEIELELSIAAIKKRTCNVLGHPGGMSLRAYNEFPLNSLEEIIKECVQNDVAFDFNSSYHLHVIKDLITLFRQHNPYISFGSDAHFLNQLGSWVKILEEQKIHV